MHWSVYSALECLRKHKMWWDFYHLFLVKFWPKASKLNFSKKQIKNKKYQPCVSFWKPHLKRVLLRVKTHKYCKRVDFYSSKESSWGTYCNEKMLSSLPSIVSESKENIPQAPFFWPMFSKKKSFLLKVFLLFRNSILQRTDVLCIAFSASKWLFWAIKIHFWNLFFVSF